MRQLSALAIGTTSTLLRPMEVIATIFCYRSFAFSGELYTMLKTLTAALLLVIVMSGCEVKKYTVTEAIPKGTIAIYPQMRVDSLGRLWMHNGFKYRLITLQ